MRKAVILVACLNMATPTYADGWGEMCGVMSQIAESIMTKRQNGISMQRLMEATVDNDSKELVEPLVIAAYDEPRYNTNRMQTRAIEDFRDHAYLHCIKTSRSNK